MKVTLKRRIFPISWSLFFVIMAPRTGCGFKLRVASVQMSDEPGAGMDGGLFGIFGGGRFSFEICQDSRRCCSSGELNTDDDNWERGERNFFVGSQLGGCEDANLPAESVVGLTVRHSGTDGGKIDHVTLRGSLRNRADEELRCQVGRKLDGDDAVRVVCGRQPPSADATRCTCNGDRRFCAMKIDEFTFAGAHNAGTGFKKNPYLECVFQNHDLNARELLDFGVRFFDLDITYRTSWTGCDGLETGHGIGIAYQCFGKVGEYVSQVADWLDENTSEVAIVHFGHLSNFDETYEELKKLLATLFHDDDNGAVVGLNRHFQKTGNWPTLGEAVASNKRLFVMVRVEDLGRVSTDEDFVTIVKVKGESPVPAEGLPPGGLSMLSTYSARDIGKDCDNAVKNARSGCETRSADFAKVAAYGARGPYDSCLNDLARRCNKRLSDVVDSCKRSRPVVNVILSDYPNYPATSRLTLPELADKENLARAPPSSAAAC